MSRQNSRIILHLGRRRITCWQADGHSVRSLATREYGARCGVQDPDCANLVRQNLEALDLKNLITSRRTIEVVLDQPFCPGLVVQLGEPLLPRQVRDSFVRSRFQAVAGVDAEQWTIDAAPDWITGTILCFGIPKTLLHSIEPSLRALNPRSLSIQPTWSWCWNQHDVRDYSGTFFSVSEHELSQAYLDHGRPLSFESAERTPSNADFDTLRDRHLLLHGMSRSSDEIRVVSLPNVDMTDESARVQPAVRRFAALGVGA